MSDRSRADIAVGPTGPETGSRPTTRPRSWGEPLPRVSHPKRGTAVTTPTAARGEEPRTVRPGCHLDDSTGEGGGGEPEDEEHKA